MSTTRWVLIEPHDTLFFRDGRPFNQDDEGAAHLASLFPPPPRTVAQMIRAALAAGRGWKAGRWGGDIAKVLGDGPDDIGTLSFRPPSILHSRPEGDEESLYPAPLALVAGFGDDEEGAELVTAVERLVPGAADGRRCDLGAVRLPRIAGDGGSGWKPLDGWLITHEGLQRFLGGETPKPTSFRKLDQLALAERRVGIARNVQSRQVVQGALYATDHRRAAGPRGRIAIRGGFDGAEGWTLAQQRPFGGEHRFAWLGESKAPAEFHLPKADGDPVRYVVMAISPVLPKGKPQDVPDAGLPGRVVSACIGKPVMLGGWSSVGPSFGPQPLQPCLPAGSVWFMEASQDAFAAAQLPAGIGELQKFGYGGCVYGSWSDDGGLGS